MTKERKLWEEALTIIDDNLGVQEDFIITNRFATATKIVDFAQTQVKKLIIPDVVNQRELLLGEMDKYLMLNTNLGVKDLLDFKERFKQ